ncbi:MAG TPA: hypothetical protein VMG99_08995 [Thermoplasmata archaeon]|nr:hypothetical protein [Thermoplasmata archaeon]
MTLRVQLDWLGSKPGRSRIPDVQLDVPVPPAQGPDGGRWEWVGPLPKQDVDLGDGFTLKLLVIRTASVADRPRNPVARDRRATPPDPAPVSAQRALPARKECPQCGVSMLPNGLAIHLAKKHGVVGATKSPSTRAQATPRDGGSRSEGGDRPTSPGEKRVETSPTSAEDVLRVLTYHFQGRAPAYIIAQFRTVAPKDVVLRWIQHGYKVLDIPPPAAGNGPDPRAVEVFTQLAPGDRLRFAERVSKWREG